MTEQELLNAYRAFDALNESAVKVKILVSYVKREFLFKTKVMQPIHLGRAVEGEAVKGAKISAEDLAWLHGNCLGDDDCEGHLSAVNRRIGLFTGTYWAWKNYERLGNPDYFGSFGYRHLLFPQCLEALSRGADYDLAAPIRPAGPKYRMNVRRWFLFLNGLGGVRVAEEAIAAVHPQEEGLFQEFLDQSDYGFNFELYVMRKGLFFEFCEWIYPMVRYMLERYPTVIDLGPRQLQYDPVAESLERDGIHQFSGPDDRDLAFVLERLTAFFMYRQLRACRDRVLLCPVAVWQSELEREWDYAWKRRCATSMFKVLHGKVVSAKGG